MQVPVYSLNGEFVEQIELSQAIFDLPFNEAVVHQAMTRQLANKRQGTASTKTRGEVIGSTRKLYPQKHTGRARRGNIKSPLLRGGGVVFGLTCARIAAEVTSEALRRGDVSAGCLQLYQRRCMETLGFDVKVMLRLRRFLDALSDEQLDAALRFCARIGVDKALGTVEEIDFQGQTLLAVLKKPAMWAALAYFLTLYLAANP